MVGANYYISWKISTQLTVSNEIVLIISGSITNLSLGIVVIRVRNRSDILDPVSLNHTSS